MPSINEWFDLLDIEYGERPTPANESDDEQVNVVKVYQENDINKTPEENKRDGQITSLLSEYVRSYKGKVNFLDKYKKRFLNLAIVWASVLVVAVIWLPIACFLVLGSDAGTIDIAGVIASEVTFAGLVFGLLKIITTYIFSPNDEKYITEIVKAIQQNDLENKKENLKHKIAMSNIISKP